MKKEWLLISTSAAFDEARFSTLATAGGGFIPNRYQQGNSQSFSTLRQVQDDSRRAVAGKAERSSPVIGEGAALSLSNGAEEMFCLMLF